MSKLATVRELTTWANMRLTCNNCSCTNILTGLMEGETMKCLLEMITSTVPKRLGSLEGLSLSQKVTRVDWFIDALKREGKLSHTLRVEAQFFAQHSSDHVYPVLWELIVKDVRLLWQIAPTFLNHSKKSLTLISEPLKAGSHIIAKSNLFEPFYKDSHGKPLTIFNQKRVEDLSSLDPERIIISLVNAQLKTVAEAKRLTFDTLKDLTNSKVLCALVNSFVPETFTSEVLLNDRWTINLALATSSGLFDVDSMLTSKDINEGDVKGSIAFLTYFFVSGFQYLQASNVVERFKDLQRRLRDGELLLSLREERQQEKSQKETTTKPSILVSAETASDNESYSKEQNALRKIQEELTWLTNTYDIDVCQEWIEKSMQVQAAARDSILTQMQNRFDIVTIPENIRSISIKDMCEEFVINLALTNGNGFYLCETKESLSYGRRIVIFDKEKGEMYDDFSGAQCPKGSVRKLLGLNPADNVEISSSSYPEYEIFLESSSKNKVLKAGNRFLYQVFPGTPKQSQRLLRQSATIGDLETVKKLIVFYQAEKGFVNITDPETGNTPLHLASRHGHFSIALHLLECGSDVNARNKTGCTPFFVAVEGLNGDICKLLIEWGGNIDIKNNISKTALEVVRNPELKTALEKKNDSYLKLRERLYKRDVKYLEKVLEAHLTGRDQMASLNSRCVDGFALLHWAALFGSAALTKKILSQRVDSNLKTSKGQTALHLTRSSEVAKVLIEGKADVNQKDYSGNTPIHTFCQDTKHNPQTPKLVTLLINAGADISLANKESCLSIHYALKHGKNDILEAMVNSREGETVKRLLKEESSDVLSKSFLYKALLNGHIDCAQWLFEKGAETKKEQVEKIAFMLLKELSNRSEIVSNISFLLRNGLNANAVSNKHQSLLHCAVQLVDHPELTDLLISNNADIHSQDESQRTPLFIACMSDNFHAARILLAYGADHSCFDMYNQTPFDYIKDYEEWMFSGYFTPDTIARLKAYSLKHSRLLIRKLTKKFKGVTVESTNMTLMD